MVVIADTSPLNYLVLVDVVDIPSWIELAPSTHLAIDPDLAELDAGERAAIALALTDHPCALLLIDDLKAREVAAKRQISTVGTLGILRDAAALGLVDLPTVFGRLRQTTFRAAPELLSDLLRQDAARRTDKKQASLPLANPRTGFQQVRAADCICPR